MMEKLIKKLEGILLEDKNIIEANCLEYDGSRHNLDNNEKTKIIECMITFNDKKVEIKLFDLDGQKMSEVYWNDVEKKTIEKLNKHNKKVLA